MEWRSVVYPSICEHRTAWMTDYGYGNEMPSHAWTTKCLLYYCSRLSVKYYTDIACSGVWYRESHHTISYHTLYTYAIVVCMHQVSPYILRPMPASRSYCCRRLRLSASSAYIYCCISALTPHKYLPRFVLALVLIHTAKTSKQFQQ